MKDYCGYWLYFNMKTGQCQRFFCGHAKCQRKGCQKAFWLKRVNLISDLIQEYHLCRFFTLTVDRSKSLQDAWGDIPAIWANFLRVVKRKYSQWRFVAILEAHKDGYPHVHGFTNTYMEQTEYSDHWSKCGGGKTVWVELIRKQEGMLADYVCKQLGRYVGKQNVVDGKGKVGYKKRTMWRSKKMKTKKEIEPSTNEWTILKGNYFDKEGKECYTVESLDSGYSVELNNLSRTEKERFSYVYDDEDDDDDQDDSDDDDDEDERRE